ncbi:T9SS type A sorting domain-containing protein [uncultured Arcticibacterium sp.]|uniref:T9SS type A sorting domain-containing protein n=1 Tax=uncultured Arcticibacterium sp. TaxID=2173042 RepID=UPI0030FCBBE2
MNLWQKTLLLLLLFATTSQAQTFTELSPSPFTGTSWSSVDVSDVNGDGFIDVMISGLASGGISISKLYLNSSGGNFTEQADSLFEGVYRSSVSFADIDMDNDEDLLITGMNSDENPIAHLYINDGLGNFTLNETNNLPGVYFSSVAFADVDADNDPDLFITGSIGQGNGIAKLFINDGSGFFEESSQNLFEGVHQSSIAFNDIDLDSDYDLIITGHNGSGGSTKLYKNDGSGNFSEELNIPFDNVYASSIAFGDIENDGDDDLLITGFSSEANKPISKLYTNDGLGNFLEDTMSTFQDFVLSSISFADMNSDGFQDILMNGFSQSIGISTAYYYRNNKNGTFVFASEIKPSTTDISPTSIISFDADNDDDLDILITGPADSTGKGRFYISEGKGCIVYNEYDFINACDSLKWIDGITYYESNATAQLRLRSEFGCDSIINLRLNLGHTSFSNNTFTSRKPLYLNGHGYIESSYGISDTLINTNGCDSIANIDVEIIREISGGGFTRDTVFSFISKNREKCFADIDNDGDLDIITYITGSLSSDLRIYLNKSKGIYELDNSHLSFLDIRIIKLVFEDINNDGLDDFLVYGRNLKSYTSEFRIYLNDKEQGFIRQTELEGELPSFNTIIPFDYNSDELIDFLVFGQIPINQDTLITYIPKTAVLKNIGLGKFEIVNDSNFPDLQNAKTSFGDVDGDNDLDILLRGFGETFSDRIEALFINNGSSQFEEEKNFESDYYFIEFGDLGDIDNDGFDDVIIHGRTIVDSVYSTTVFSGSSDNSFLKKTYDSSSPFIWSRISKYGDFDNDGDLDLIASDRPWPFIYINDGTGNFTKAIDSPFLEHLGYNPDLIDLDEDGYLDIVSYDKIYFNDGCTPNYVVDSIVSYYPYTWIDGKTYDESNDYSRVIFKNQYDCDSIIALNLEIRNTPREGGFIEVTPKVFEAAKYASIALGDVDGNNKIDLAISGIANNLGSNIYINQGDRKFINHSQRGFPDGYNSQIEFIDIDGDKDMDLIILNDLVTIYTNTGSGFFENTNQSIAPSLSSAAIEFGDLNQDGFPDFVLSGYDGAFQRYYSNIFTNNGSGLYSTTNQAIIDPFAGDVKLVDIDGDIDLDIIIVGENTRESFFKVYKNDGLGSFDLFDSKIPIIIRPNWGFQDLDGDFDLDLVISGWESGSNISFTRIYQNNGDGEFTQINSLDDEYFFWAMDFADLDRDGDSDFIVNEEDNSGNLFTSIYRNNGSLNFSRNPNSAMVGVRYSDIKVADLDGDTAPDVIITGILESDKAVTKIYYSENKDNECYTTYSSDLIISDAPVSWIDGNTYFETTNSVTHTLSNAMGCDSIVTLNLLIKEKVLSNESINMAISVYPNPSNNLLKIKNKGVIQPHDYSIINSQGQLLVNWKSSKQEQLIDISPIPSGTYILKYQDGIKSESLKFVKR